MQYDIPDFTLEVRQGWLYITMNIAYFIRDSWETNKGKYINCSRVNSI